MSEKLSAKELAVKLNLMPHPEGGYFRETYRSEEVVPSEVLGEHFEGDRNCSTCIYFMLTSNAFSAFHKIQQDEFWHFYLGSPIELHMISPVGNHSKLLIGNDLLNNEQPQIVVPKHFWFAAKVIKPESHALVGCTVSPGFDFRDFTLAKRSELIQLYPQHQTLIEEFTRN